MELMEGVEDIPLGAMDQGIKWEWETFPQYVEALSKKSFAIDIGALVGHGPVRAFVLGRRANLSDRPNGPKKDPVTPEEIQQIADVVYDAVKAGALGFSTSRTLMHRDRAGVLVPGTLATEAELLAIGKALGEAGNGKAIFEMASDFMSGDDEKHTPENHAERLKHFGREFLWIKTMSKGFGVPLMYCLGIPSAAKQFAYGYRQMLRTVSAANGEGCNIKVQVFTRPQGILCSFDARSHPFTDCETFDRVWRTTRNATTGEFDKAQLLNPDVKRAILAEAYQLARDTEAGHLGVAILQSTDSDGPGNLNASVTSKGALAKMYLENLHDVFKWTSTYEPASKDSALAVGRATNKDPLEVMYDWMCEDNCSQVLSYMFFGYAHHNLDDHQEMLLHPDTIPGLGDTGAHLGFLCDPTSPTYLLTHWYRDRASGPKFPLEFAVKRHSKDTANAFALSDRGSVEVGLLADLNVIDLTRLEILKPRFVRDLPKGAARWIQEVRGYDYTIKSGVVTFVDNVPTGRLPGRLVKRQDVSGEVESKLVGEFFNNSAIAKFKMMLRTSKWEAEQKALEAMIALVGAPRLEQVGVLVNQYFPLLDTKKPIQSKL